jgi:uncharacterized membrane protein YhhN
MNWLFWAAIASGIVYGAVLMKRPQSHFRAVAKTVPVALLAASAWASGLPLLLVLALALCALGDLFLAYDGERAFLAGLVAFLLGHVVYSVLFFDGQDPGWSASMPFFAGTVAIFAFALGIFRALRPKLGDLRLPVMVYTGILSAMAVAALSRGPDPLLLSGVVLLMASDAVLAFEKFAFDTNSPNKAWSGPFIWFSYFFGQVLVVLAFAAG